MVLSSATSNRTVEGQFSRYGFQRVQGKAICASLQALSFEPCFTVTRTSDQSFRASFNGMAIIAYCDFTEQTSAADSPRD